MNLVNNKIFNFYLYYNNCFTICWNNNVHGFIFYWNIIYNFALIIYFIYKLIFNKTEEKNKFLKSFIKSISFPLIGIFVAILFGALIMILTKYDPIKAYKALFYGGFYKNWHVSVLNAVPLIFTGLSIAIAFQAGLFNIGAEGQYYVGALMAAFLGLYFNLPPFLSIFLIFIFLWVSLRFIQFYSSVFKS